MEKVTHQVESWPKYFARWCWLIDTVALQNSSTVNTLEHVRTAGTIITSLASVGVIIINCRQVHCASMRWLPYRIRGATIRRAKSMCVSNGVIAKLDYGGLREISICSRGVPLAGEPRSSIAAFRIKSGVSPVFQQPTYQCLSKNQNCSDISRVRRSITPTAATASQGSTRTQLTIPLFSIRHQKIGGTESAIYNLISGLHQVGCSPRLGLPALKHLSPDFVAWLREHSVRTSSLPRLIPADTSRFVQESIFTSFSKRDELILFPNYFIPPNKLNFSSFSILHDIQYRELPAFHRARRRAWLDFYLPKMFKYSRKVFLISKFEQAQVEKHFGAAAADKCAVIYNAINWARYDRTGDCAVDMTRSAPYIMCVSHPFPHKNLPTLLSAFSILAGRQRHAQLLMVGNMSSVSEQLIARHIPSDIVSRVRFTGFLSDAQLGELYRGASVLALPSLYEGFGMPAVEALGLGTPALVSDIPVMREVTDGHAWFVRDYQSPMAWADSLGEALRIGKRPSAATSLSIKERYDPNTVANRLLTHLC